MVCVAVVWPVYLSGDVILATLLVKIFRIHHIFGYFGKLSGFCSDRSLFLLIILLSMVKVTFLAVWTAIDRFVAR